MSCPRSAPKSWQPSPTAVAIRRSTEGTALDARAPIVWRQRQRALPATAALARAAAADVLAERLLALDDRALAELRGAASADALIVLGAPDALPWVDGVEYLCRDPRAPGPLWPSALEPAVAPALIARALATRCPPPFAIVLDPAALVPVGGARPVARDQLRGWLARRRGGEAA